MILSENNRAQALDELLSIVCERFQLPPSLYDEAEKRYVAVGRWLRSPESELHRFSPDIYSQGSFRIGTTVKPLGRDEFDLDLVCEMDIDYDATSPAVILNAVEKRLRENGTYARMIERKKRCVRLTYAKRFHLDILPAAPEILADGTRVQVPDRELRCWKPSDPKGYARWFESRSGEYRRMLEKRQEPLPDPETADEKTPLQRAVQLLKRARHRLRARFRPCAALHRPDDARGTRIRGRANDDRDSPCLRRARPRRSGEREWTPSRPESSQ